MVFGQPARRIILPAVGISMSFAVRTHSDIKANNQNTTFQCCRWTQASSASAGLSPVTAVDAGLRRGGARRAAWGGGTVQLRPSDAVAPLVVATD